MTPSPGMTSGHLNGYSHTKNIIMGLTGFDWSVRKVVRINAQAKEQKTYIKSTG